MILNLKNAKRKYEHNVNLIQKEDNMRVNGFLK